MDMSGNGLRTPQVRVNHMIEMTLNFRFVGHFIPSVFAYASFRWIKKMSDDVKKSVHKIEGTIMNMIKPLCNGVLIF